MKSVAGAIGTLAAALLLVSTLAGAQTWKPPAESGVLRSRWAADVREGTVTVQEERWQPWRFDHEEAPR